MVTEILGESGFLEFMGKMKSKNYKELIHFKMEYDMMDNNVKIKISNRETYS